MKTYLTTILILNCLLSFTLAVSDDNICEESCQYCCRNKQCQSESTCKGNYQPFIILGCIAGGLIALFIARRVYVHYRNKAMIARGEDPKAKKGTRARWRSRKGSKSPNKEKKEKAKKDKPRKARSSSKPTSVKSLKDVEEKKSNRSKGDIYLQIDNESVLSNEDAPKSTANKNDGKTSSRNDLNKPTSKNEILVASNPNLNEKLNDTKTEKNDKKNDKKVEKKVDKKQEKKNKEQADKDRLNPFKQNKMPDKENKKDDKGRSTSKGKSANPNSMRDSKIGGSTTAKERGRSKEPGGDKSGSQKKTTSAGPRGEKSRGNSAGTRKNQI